MWASLSTRLPRPSFDSSRRNCRPISSFFARSYRRRKNSPMTQVSHDGRSQKSSDASIVSWTDTPNYGSSSRRNQTLIDLDGGNSPKRHPSLSPRRAFRVRLCGQTYIVPTHCAAWAKGMAVRHAIECNYHITCDGVANPWREVRCQRAPEHDEWARENSRAQYEWAVYKPKSMTQPYPL